MEKKKITAFGSSHSIISAIPVEGPCLFLNRTIKNPGWVSLALTNVSNPCYTPTSGPITLAEGMNALTGLLWVTCLPWSQLAGLAALELHWQRVREGAVPQGKSKCCYQKSGNRSSLGKASISIHQHTFCPQEDATLHSWHPLHLNCILLTAWLGSWAPWPEHRGLLWSQNTQITVPSFSTSICRKTIEHWSQWVTVGMKRAPP